MHSRDPIVLVLRSVQTQTVRHDPNIVAIDITAEGGQVYRFGLLRSEFGQLVKRLVAAAELLTGNTAGTA